MLKLSKFGVEARSRAGLLMKLRTFNEILLHFSYTLMIFFYTRVTFATMVTSERHASVEEFHFKYKKSVEEFH